MLPDPRRTRSLAYVFILLGFLRTLSTGQTTPFPADEELKVSTRDQAALRTLAKRFVSRIQVTHDVGPLINEFFLDHFEDVIGKDMFWVRKYPGDIRLTKSDLRKNFVADVNILYLLSMTAMTNGKEDLSSILPPELGRQLIKLSGGDRDATSTSISKTDFLLELDQFTRLYSVAKKELARRKIESSPAYRNTIKRRRNDPGYFYSVSSTRFWDPSWAKDITVPEALRQRFPSGLTGYLVTTPLGLGLAFVKQPSGFKMVAIGPYPYD